MTANRARFGLATLLCWVSFFAVACAVVKTGSPGLGTAFQVCFLLTLGYATILSIAADGSRRCFWACFLVFVVIYYASMWDMLNWLDIDNDEIPLLSLVNNCIEELHPRVNLGGGRVLPEEGEVAMRAAHRTLAITFGCIAGTLSTFVYNRRNTATDEDAASR